MATIDIICPQCKKNCHVPVEDGELRELSTTQGFEWKCACGCEFVFDIHVEVMNKKVAE